MVKETNNRIGIDIKFSHVHMYVDRVMDVNFYKDYEESINAFHGKFENITIEDIVDVSRGQQVWNSMHGGCEDVTQFEPHDHDVVKQLIAGFGFRVTGSYPNTNDSNSAGTKSVLVTASDQHGIQIIVSSLNEKIADVEHFRDFYRHFDPANISTFYKVHSNRQGIAVLAFEVGHGCLEEIFRRYSDLHPNLLPEEYKLGARVYKNEASVLEVLAYYKGEKQVSDADEGTRLRFLEPIDSESRIASKCTLPGVASVPAKFHSSCRQAYFDHWVSNVISREGFLDTLEDTLHFTPKVDFNAGVVAAGEAQIESTVTGNSSSFSTTEKDAALRDQSQIYLPINNALTNVGHVHGFLEEIGQGVQHIASRVDDIISFVQQANDRRKMFNEGFTFLSIPRSYYGVLTQGMLVKGMGRKHDISSESEESFLSHQCAQVIFDICVSERILQDDFSVDLEMPNDTIKCILDSNIPSAYWQEYSCKKDGVVETILHSRYVNLYNLLRDHLSEDSYIGIVRNQILVDVQGDDLLFQIFTSNILQRNMGEEAPFFEFIQRVCSERNADSSDGCPKPLKPGCGGFGIRNFLTLFLSIEVTKTLLEASSAKDRGDDVQYEYACRKTAIFTDQLNESNPILTEISDAMTREGAARNTIAALGREGDKNDIKHWEGIVEKESLMKMDSNEKLMKCNAKYQQLMKTLRESQSRV